jgi:hypothetical protein
MAVDQTMSETDELPESSYGLVAFFDILGYRQIITNNEIREAALIVKRILQKVTDLQEAADGFEKRYQFLPAPKYLVFSDSILVYTSYSSNQATRKSQAGAFAACCMALCRDLLEEGLPARGAIARGEFFIEKNSFVGKPIVEAYELANALELSGCVIAPTAEAEFVGQDDPLKLLFQYPVPLKENQKQDLYTLNLCFSLLVNDSEDPRQFAIKQFGRHNKNIGPDVIGKLNNTVVFL